MTALHAAALGSGAATAALLVKAGESAVTHGCLQAMQELCVDQSGPPEVLVLMCFMKMYHRTGCFITVCLQKDSVCGKWSQPLGHNQVLDEPHSVGIAFVPRLWLDSHSHASLRCSSQYAVNHSIQLFSGRVHNSIQKSDDLKRWKLDGFLSLWSFIPFLGAAWLCPHFQSTNF